MSNCAYPRRTPRPQPEYIGQTLWEEQTRVITIPSAAVPYAVFNAQQAMVNTEDDGYSSSRIHHDLDERLSKSAEEQLTGQLGQIAQCLYEFNSLDTYHESRAYHNAHPRAKGLHSDIPNLAYDTKTSVIRTTRPLLEHNLLLREAECVPDFVYILALILAEDMPLDQVELAELAERLPMRNLPSVPVTLVGWVPTKELDYTAPYVAPPVPGFVGFFLPAYMLHPLPPRKWG
jgi:hypothetical protein